MLNDLDKRWNLGQLANDRRRMGGALSELMGREKAESCVLEETDGGVPRKTA